MDCPKGTHEVSMAGVGLNLDLHDCGVFNSGFLFKLKWGRLLEADATRLREIVIQNIQKGTSLETAKAEPKQFQRDGAIAHNHKDSCGTVINTFMMT